MMSKHNPTTAERILLQRKARGWSQQKLAGRFSPRTAQATISDVEQGKISPTIDWLTRAAIALQIRTRDLVPEEKGISHTGD